MRHHSRFRGPRGRVQCTKRKVQVGNVEVSGVKPRILATVKTGNQKWRDHFAHLCAELGLLAEEVQTIGWVTVYDVCGTMDALSEMVADNCVNNWEYALDVRTPRGGMGTRPEKRTKWEPRALDQRMANLRKQQEQRTVVGLA